MRLVIVLLICLLSVPASAAEKSAYRHVMETKTLRCGYVSWPPLFDKDPNTGKFTGIFYEYTEALGKKLGLKIEWTEELTPATYIESMKSGRTDMLCSGDWPNETRAEHIQYTEALFVNVMLPYVHADDDRFDSLDKINDPSVTIVTIDGEMSSLIAAADFPKAKIFSLPQTADASQMLLAVAGGKADVALVVSTDGERFKKGNPGKLKAAAIDRPVRSFENTLSMLKGENELQALMNKATAELSADGTIDSIINHYEEFPGTMIRDPSPKK